MHKTHQPNNLKILSNSIYYNVENILTDIYRLKSIKNDAYESLFRYVRLSTKKIVEF